MTIPEKPKEKVDYSIFEKSLDRLNATIRELRTIESKSPIYSDMINSLRMARQRVIDYRTSMRVLDRAGEELASGSVLETRKALDDQRFIEGP